MSTSPWVLVTAIHHSHIDSMASTSTCTEKIAVQGNTIKFVSEGVTRITAHFWW